MRPENLPGEEWRPVVGLEERYEVSSYGRVWSRARPYVRSGRLMRPSPGRHGYPAVGLRGEGSKLKTSFLHQLVAEAFLGPRPAGQQVRHIDGNPQNPRLDNLLYGTASENVYDSVRHGTHPQASKTHCPQGHPYDAANTYSPPALPSYRYCRTCVAAHRARYNERRRMEVTA